MDEGLATQYEAELKGQRIPGYRVGPLLGFGKSAAVFEAWIDDGSVRAIKLFDRELVRRVGDEQQRKRVELEKTLSVNIHPNIVRVFESGYSADFDIFFVVMDRVKAPNLEQLIRNANGALPPAQGIFVLRQLLSAAIFLDSIGLAHRDIKPSNTAVQQDGSTTLLDLGVLRGVGDPNGTDAEGHREFVGTLRYSPPEFLTRTEADDVDGWRAVTIYQLAATAHDIITGLQIFRDREPYAQLVEAVIHEIPEVSSEVYPPSLLNIVRSGLLKSPVARLELAGFERWSKALDSDAAASTARERIKQRVALRRAQSNEAAHDEQSVITAEALTVILKAAFNRLSVDLPRGAVYVMGEVVVIEFDDRADFELGDKFVISLRPVIRNAATGEVAVSASASQERKGGERTITGPTFEGVCSADALDDWLQGALFELVDRGAAP